MQKIYEAVTHNSRKFFVYKCALGYLSYQISRGNDIRHRCGVGVLF